MQYLAGLPPEDIRCSRASKILTTLCCLGHPDHPMKARKNYYEGEEWVEHIDATLFRVEDHYSHLWPVSFSVGSGVFGKLEHYIASQSVLIYYPLVNLQLKRLLECERVLASSLLTELRNIVLEYLEENADTVRAARF